MSRSPSLRLASHALSTLAFVALGAACAGPAAPAPDGATPPPVAASVAPPPATSAATPTTSAAAPSASAAAPTPSASAAAPTADASAAPSAAPTAAPEAKPLPEVKVANIGMHIGGGPNDAVTKEPIKKSVEPHFDELRACWTEAEDQDKGGDVGVDLRIERGGGKAKVSHPRTTIKGKGFAACVVRVFEALDFLPPKGGTTTVSYSLRFTPGKGGDGTAKRPSKARAR